MQENKRSPYQGYESRPRECGREDREPAIRTLSEMRSALGCIRAVTDYGHPCRMRMIALAVMEPLKSLSVLLTPLITQLVIDQAYPSRNLLLLLALFAAKMGLEVVDNVIAIASGYLETYLASLLQYRLSLRVCDAILHMPLSYREEHASGMLLERANADVAGIVSTVVQLMPQIATITFTFVVAAVLMMKISIGVSLIILLVVPLNYWITTRMTRRLVALNIQARALAERLTTFTSEMIEGATITQVFCWTRARRRKCAALLRTHLVTRFALWRTRIFWGRFNTLVNGAWGVVLLCGGWYLVFTNHLQLGQAVALGMYASILWQPFRQLERLYESILSNSVSSQRVLEILDERQPAASTIQRATCRVAPRCLRLRDLSFGYQRGRPCLQGINLELRAGQTIAIVGPSGAGKSTLLRILCGLDDRYAGEFLVDGQEFRGIRPDSYFRHTALVPQNNVFFSESIRDNLLCDGMVSEERLQKYVEILGLTQVIATSPQGYETKLGWQGIRLSAGQYQKLAVLRALLKPASILLLDEITSSMDIESERQLLQGIAVLRSPKCLALLVTHHILVTAESWIDQIIVLDGGRVQEVGSCEELLGRRGLYFQWVSHARSQQWIAGGNRGSQRGVPL